MKRSIVILAAMLCIAICGSTAQDTIQTTQLRENYFANYWPEGILKPGAEIGRTTQGCYDTFLGQWGGIKLNAIDSLKIYGLAISVVPDNEIYPDTLFHLTSFRLQVIEVTPTNKDVKGEDLYIYADSTTPAYYWYTGFRKCRYPEPYTMAFPMYELYYKHPIIVYDSFFIGGSQNIVRDTAVYSNGHVHYPQLSNSYCINAWYECPNGFNQYSTPQIVSFLPQQPAPEGWETQPGRWWYTRSQTIPLFFPILTPDPNRDTTGYIPNDSTLTGDTTQTSIQRASWERYVSLQPNPATDEVTVLSSFGMTQVELFDMAGTRVMVHEANGLSAKLDVATLPRGSYIARIHTPRGVTSRKLVVQR